MYSLGHRRLAPGGAWSLTGLEAEPQCTLMSLESSLRGRGPQRLVQGEAYRGWGALW